MSTIIGNIGFVLVISTALAASKCDENGTDASSDDPESVCEYVENKCDLDYWDSHSACISNLEDEDECRLECVLNVDGCDKIDQCLGWSLGYDGAADKYCLDEEADPLADDQNSQNDDDASSSDTGNYVSLEACAANECTTENDACERNSDCTGIYEDCYDTCADMLCIATCALTYYPNGISDHDALYDCMQTNCSTFLN